MNAQQVVDSLLEDADEMYVSAVLTAESKARLLEAVPAIHEKVYADHVTLAFKPDAKTLARWRQMEGKTLRIPVLGVVSDHSAQAVLVRTESSNRHPHITISVTPGTAPAYSNDLLARMPVKQLKLSVDAQVVIEPLS